jgi:hypothetical protein
MSVEASVDMTEFHVADTQPLTQDMEFVVAPPSVLLFAERITHNGKYGLRNMGFRDPESGRMTHISTVEGYTGPEFQVIDPDGNESYWRRTGGIPELLAGYPPAGNFTEPQWTVSPPAKKP